MKEEVYRFAYFIVFFAFFTGGFTRFFGPFFFDGNFEIDIKGENSPQGHPLLDSVSNHFFKSCGREKFLAACSCCLCYDGFYH